MNGLTLDYLMTTVGDRCESDRERVHDLAMVALLTVARRLRDLAGPNDTADALLIAGLLDNDCEDMAYATPQLPDPAPAADLLGELLADMPATAEQAGRWAERFIREAWRQERVGGMAVA